MTCIVAVEHEGRVYMGGDSAAVSGLDIQAVVSPKVFLLGDILIGYTSSFRMGQLLEYNLEVPENKHGDDDLRYLVTGFVPAVRECLKAGGFTKIENGVEDGGSFLIGYKGKVYLVASDFQVTRMRDGFAAVGCGTYYALGALGATEILDAEKAVTLALEVSARFSAGVCGPFYVLSK